MSKITFKPKQVTKRILSPLKDRSYDVVVNRFGLGEATERKTLESIGDKYGITRERVRQIESAALATIRKSEYYKLEQAILDELHVMIKSMGALVSEDEFLSQISKDESTQNHIHFYLTLGEPFTKHKEDEHFKSRWTVDGVLTDKVHTALKKMYESMSDEELVADHDVVEKFITHLEDVADEYKTEEIIKRWLRISNKISPNPLGEWGKAHSSNVKTRGIRDYAYLMMRKHGSPMHFREVAEGINKTFGKETHVATCHNELIKDSRFILVGRGVYALAEWGYKPGIVRDVIKDILKKEGPLTKDEIADRVMKERYLKKNTILVNLQNAKHFKKTKEGKYTLA